MTWLTWRQYRAQFAVGTVILAALCLLLLLTGLQLVSQYHTVITQCASGINNGQNGVNCTIGGGLFSGGPTVGFVSLILLATPVLAGLFLGAPMVAAEFQAGPRSSPGRRASPGPLARGQGRLAAARRGGLGRASSPP